MPSATVRTGIDDYTNEAYPNSNAGLSKSLYVRGGTPNRLYSWLYLKSPVPRGAIVLSATLHLAGYGSWGGSETVTVQRVATAWAESTITWNTMPTATGVTASVTQNETVDGQDWAFDVTAMIQALANGASNYGFRITTASTTSNRFYSLNAGDNRPYMVVSWADAPVAPTELVPSGGAAVTLAKPVLQFNFHDVSGTEAMQACRVELKTTNTGWTADPVTGGFASPDFDSGTVSTSDPELDLSTTAYAGLGLAASVYWTVQVQDTAGQWSPWSVPTSFTRVARGTLSISNPSGGIVYDATPPIIWSLTGATQTGYQLIITDDADPFTQLWNTGRKAGTITTLTVPAGVITSETATYPLTVRTWDSLTRVATPGDLIHTEAVTTFGYQDSVTPAPASSVTATQVANGQPAVQLDIVRSTAPDYWSIWRDGKVVKTDIVPASIFLSGTTYRFIDRTAQPGVAHTYKVRAKVNGLLSTPVTAALTYQVVGFWLCDDASGKLVPVIATVNDQTSYDMPETSTVYRAINGKAGVTITQGQSGLSGSISGRVMDWAGGTAASWVLNLFWMKARPQLTYRLIIGNQNLNVNLRDVVIAPLNYPNSADDRQVSFSFESLDGPTRQ